MGTNGHKQDKYGHGRTWTELILCLDGHGQLKACPCKTLVVSTCLHVFLGLTLNFISIFSFRNFTTGVKAFKLNVDFKTVIFIHTKID